MKSLKHIILSKLEIPQAVPLSVERSVLLDIICGCRERIVVIQGEAGYGKTELARQYCEKSEKKAIWYSLDETDNDPLQFLAYLEQAILIQEHCTSTEDLISPKEPIRKTIQKIQLHLNGFFEEQGVLVLDSFEKITNNDIYILMQYILKYSSCQHKLVIISRKNMPDFFYKYVLEGQCKIIDEALLAYLEEEQLKKIDMELKIGEEEAKKLLDQSLFVLEGWPACLTLALLGIQKSGHRKDNLNWDHFIYNSMIYNFINYEIFEKLSEELKNCLIEHALLEEIDTNLISKTILNQLIAEKWLFPMVDGNYGKLFIPRIVRIFLNSMAGQGIDSKAMKPREIAISIHETYTEAAASKIITVHTFGDFSVKVVGAEKALSWRTKKGSELFAYLVELNGQPVGRRLLMQKLWEDEMPDNAVTMFHNMIYNIRKELAVYNIHDLICYMDRLYSVNMKLIKTDGGEKRHICSLVDKGDVAELVKYSDSFKVYWGRYLEDMDCLWAQEQREYYDTRFCKGSNLLADYYIKQKDWEKAVIFLKNALIINTYSEEIMGNLLTCYGSLRNIRQAKKEYERFCILLECDLGIDPGEELRKNYHLIIKSKRNKSEGY